MVRLVALPSSRPETEVTVERAMRGRKDFCPTVTLSGRASKLDRGNAVEAIYREGAVLDQRRSAWRGTIAEIVFIDDQLGAFDIQPGRSGSGRSNH